MHPDTRVIWKQIARVCNIILSTFSGKQTKAATSHLKGKDVFFFLIFFFPILACKLPLKAESPLLQTPSDFSTPEAGLRWVPYGSPTLTPFLPRTQTPPPTISQDTSQKTETNTPPLFPITPTPESNQLISKPSGNSTTVAKFRDKEHINILLIGSDRRSSTSFRTDTLIILSLQPKEKLVTLISIPRDLYVEIPGWRTNRINTAYLHGEIEDYPGGGAALLKETIKKNLGVQIHHLSIIEFSGFRQIIDTMEGIDVPLACEFTDWHVINPNKSLQDPNNWKLHSIGPGLIHMDGETALWYARSRLRSNDFDRGRRQQEVLRAIYSRGMQLQLIPKIPKLYRDLQDTFFTDLDLEDIISLAPLAFEMNSAHIRSFYINKEYTISWRTPQGASVLLPRTDKIKKMINEAMNPPDKNEAEHLSTIIEIINASSNEDWSLLASERLNYAGYQSFISSKNSRKSSETILFDLTPKQDPDKRAELLNLLNLAPSKTVLQPTDQSEINYRLVLGTDYDPCFNPFNIKR